MNDRVFYYGGNDASVYFVGVRNSMLRDRSQRSSDNRRPMVYIDLVGRRDASVHGWKPEDAANELAASLPTYFRKSWLTDPSPTPDQPRPRE